MHGGYPAFCVEKNILPPSLIGRPSRLARTPFLLVIYISRGSAAFLHRRRTGYSVQRTAQHHKCSDITRLAAMSAIEAPPSCWSVSRLSAWLAQDETLDPDVSAHENDMRADTLAQCWKHSRTECWQSYSVYRTSGQVASTIL